MSRGRRIRSLLSTAGITAILAAAGMTACGDKGPTGPEADLADTWIFVGTDFAEVISARLVDLFVEAGLTHSEAQALVDEFGVEIDEDFDDLRSTMRFNADNTWKDDSGNKGRWRIEDDVLELTDEEDDTVQRFKYFLDGDDLTLILTKEYFLSLMRPMEDFDAEAYEFYNEILEEGDVLRFFFKRKS